MPPRRITLGTLWQRAHSLVTERYLGIDTTGLFPPIAEGFGHYAPLPYRVIFAIFRRLNLNPSDVFVDIGCGKGRAICCACRVGVSRVIGIEVFPQLVEKARENLKRLRGPKCEAEIHCIYAEQFDYKHATVLYMYNPFNEENMRKTLLRIKESWQANPREIRIAYANNLFEAALAEVDWLSKEEEWPARMFPGFDCPIAFWRTVPLGTHASVYGNRHVQAA